MAQIFQEVPAEILHTCIDKLTGDNTVLLSAGSVHLYSSSVASCRFASGLTFMPVAACFIRPQKHVIRFIEKNDYFTLSYFSPEHRHILDFFSSRQGSVVSALSRKFEPRETRSGNLYFPQARLVLECRKVFNLELILSHEIQKILLSEQARQIYPGGEVPRMFVGQIEHCWMGVEPALLQ
jgi:flavin reductase (DIM6/NTAB) family NADH-FMN oxidoreductase RutF